MSKRNKMNAANRRMRRRSLVKRDGVWCALCGEYMSPDDRTMDHIQPQAGNIPESNHLTNLRLMHHACNMFKADKILTINITPREIDALPEQSCVHCNKKLDFSDPENPSYRTADPKTGKIIHSGCMKIHPDISIDALRNCHKVLAEYRHHHKTLTKA